MRNPLIGGCFSREGISFGLFNPRGRLVGLFSHCLLLPGFVTRYPFVAGNEEVSKLRPKVHL